MGPEMLQEDVEGDSGPPVGHEQVQLRISRIHPSPSKGTPLSSSGLGSGLGIPVDSKAGQVPCPQGHAPTSAPPTAHPWQ